MDGFFFVFIRFDSRCLRWCSSLALPIVGGAALPVGACFLFGRSSATEGIRARSAGGGSGADRVGEWSHLFTWLIRRLLLLVVAGSVRTIGVILLFISLVVPPSCSSPSFHACVRILFLTRSSEAMSWAKT
jgi:hypothetical protein